MSNCDVDNFDEVIKVTCENCSEIIDSDESVSVDGKIYCHDCTSSCHHCGGNILTDDAVSCEGRRGETRLLCSDCTEDHTFYCGDCDEVFYIPESQSYTNPHGESICHNCRDGYSVCEACDSLVFSDDIIYSDDNDAYYCPDCSAEHCNNSIKDHNFKPTPKFHKTPNDKGVNPLYIGFELEVEVNDGSRSELAESINDDFFYCKKDGSLSNGFEVVTHPFTRLWFYENLKNDTFKKMFDLSKQKCKSYDTSTCGLHFHMSKDHFTSLHLYKIMKLMYENTSDWRAISRRKEYEFDRWCGTNKNKDLLVKESKDKSNYDTRYTALNITSHTVECRIFRGTLNQESFVGNLEILFAMVDFTRVTSIANITFENYTKFINEQKKYKFAKILIDHINERKTSATPTEPVDA